ncbi:uncharacterized protein BROUX77_003949 [Berkeleyomyces rouxiae]|uniref:uncharacterized protein n=1 Tax=Berkeleyomyces rouxiae TaxID=2035830 RepID=UPI003B76F052
MRLGIQDTTTYATENATKQPAPEPETLRQTSRIVVEIPHIPPPYVPGSGPVSQDATIIPIGDSTAYIIDRLFLSEGLAADGKPRPNSLAWLIGFHDQPAARVVVRAHRVHDYVSPREFEEYEYRQWQRRENEKERLTKTVGEGFSAEIDAAILSKTVKRAPGRPSEVSFRKIRKPGTKKRKPANRGLNAQSLETTPQLLPNVAAPCVEDLREAPVNIRVSSATIQSEIPMDIDIVSEEAPSKASPGLTVLSVEASPEAFIELDIPTAESLPKSPLNLSAPSTETQSEIPMDIDVPTPKARLEILLSPVTPLVRTPSEAQLDLEVPVTKASPELSLNLDVPLTEGSPEIPLNLKDRGMESSPELSPDLSARATEASPELSLDLVIPSKEGSPEIPLHADVLVVESSPEPSFDLDSRVIEASPEPPLDIDGPFVRASPELSLNLDVPLTEGSPEIPMNLKDRGMESSPELSPDLGARATEASPELSLDLVIPSKEGSPEIPLHADVLVVESSPSSPLDHHPRVIEASPDVPPDIDDLVLESSPEITPHAVIPSIEASPEAPSPSPATRSLQTPPEAPNATIPLEGQVDSTAPSVQAQSDILPDLDVGTLEGPSQVALELVVTGTQNSPEVSPTLVIPSVETEPETPLQRVTVDMKTPPEMPENLVVSSIEVPSEEPLDPTPTSPEAQLVALVDADSPNVQTPLKEPSHHAAQDTLPSPKILPDLDTPNVAAPSEIQPDPTAPISKTSSTVQVPEATEPHTKGLSEMSIDLDAPSSKPGHERLEEIDTPMTEAPHHKPSLDPVAAILELQSKPPSHPGTPILEPIEEAVPDNAELSIKAQLEASADVVIYPPVVEAPSQAQLPEAAVSSAKTPSRAPSKIQSLKSAAPIVEAPSRNSSPKPASPSLETNSEVPLDLDTPVAEVSSEPSPDVPPPKSKLGTKVFGLENNATPSTTTRKKRSFDAVDEGTVTPNATNSDSLAAKAHLSLKGGKLGSKAVGSSLPTSPFKRVRRESNPTRSSSSKIQTKLPRRPTKPAKKGPPTPSPYDFVESDGEDDEGNKILAKSLIPVKPMKTPTRPASSPWASINGSSVKRSTERPVPSQSTIAKVGKAGVSAKEDRDSSESLGEDEYIVEALVDVKNRRGKLFFLVCWEGDWPPDQKRTWEPYENINEAMVKEYLESHPAKAKSAKAEGVLARLTKKKPKTVRKNPRSLDKIMSAFEGNQNWLESNEGFATSGKNKTASDDGNEILQVTDKGKSIDRSLKFKWKK